MRVLNVPVEYGVDEVRYFLRSFDLDSCLVAPFPNPGVDLNYQTYLARFETADDAHLALAKLNGTVIGTRYAKLVLYKS